MNLNRLTILIFLIIFSLQSLTKADDIRDFEIEGMSIGDNLFDFISNEEFEDNRKGSKIHFHKNKKFAELNLYKLEKFETYDAVRVVWKPGDKNYELYGVSGLIYFKKNFKDCENKKKAIVADISKSLNKIEKIDRGKIIHPFDKTGNSYFNEIYFPIDGLDSIRIYCMNWSKKMENENNFWDALNVIIASKEFGNFLNNEAYK